MAGICKRSFHFIAMFRFPTQAQPDFESSDSPEIAQPLRLDCPLAQQPISAQSAVASEASPLEPSHPDGKYRFWGIGKEALLRFSQVDQFSQSALPQCSEVAHFIGSQASPTFQRGAASQSSCVEFCSQLHPPTFPWTVFGPNSPSCAPRYHRSFLSNIREDDTLHNPRTNLFARQTDVDAEARSEQLYWIVQHVPMLEISSKAIFVSAKLLDRLLVSKQIDRAKLRLQAVCCLSLAAKSESQFYPQLKTYVKLNEGLFGEEELLAAEFKLLQDLKWQTNATTVILYLKMWVNALAGDVDLALTTIFVALCTLVSPELAIEDCELVAIAVMAVALHAWGMAAQPPELAEAFERFAAGKVRECIGLVVGAVHGEVGNEESPIREMFAIPERGSVALLSFGCPSIE
jgi:hypothetical protein